jgi:hypothetical protein
MARPKKVADGSKDLFHLMLRLDGGFLVLNPKEWIEQSNLVDYYLNLVAKKDAIALSKILPENFDAIEDYQKAIVSPKMSALARTKASQQLGMRLWAINYFNYRKYTSKAIVSHKMVAPKIRELLISAYPEDFIDIPNESTITTEWLSKI